MRVAAVRDSGSLARLEVQTCIVVGGGLAGLSCSAALADAGFAVTLLETRPYPGGRATSYQLPGLTEPAESIDNCQHVLLRCCVNLLDFYRRLGVDSQIRFEKEFQFLEPGGRRSRFEAGVLPAPMHFAGSFLRLKSLTYGEKIAVARAMLALRREWPSRKDLDRITMLEWLREKRQPGRAVERFWRPVLVSAINEELDRMAARHGLQVMWLGFLARRDSYEMGVPSVPLGSLYDEAVWKRFPAVDLQFRTPVGTFEIDSRAVRCAKTRDGSLTADFYVSAVPFERLPALVPALGLDFSQWEHSPITGIHLWFDRPVTDLPHGALLDRTIQWFFNKAEGPVYPTRRERLAKPLDNGSGGSDRTGAARTRGIPAGSQGSGTCQSPRGEGGPGHVLGPSGFGGRASRSGDQYR